jgi:hypothetical protein
LYSDEETPLEEKLIYGHFFIGGCDWFIAEWDGGDLFFGYANLGDDQCAEWGYISFSELKSLNSLMVLKLSMMLIGGFDRPKKSLK